MSNRKPRTPSYRYHKPSGQAVVTLNGRDFYLCTYGSDASRSRYDRLIAEWLSACRRIPANANEGITISELIAAYWQFAQTYYRKSDRPTGELSRIKAATRPLRKLYGSTAADNVENLNRGPAQEAYGS